MASHFRRLTPNPFKAKGVNYRAKNPRRDSTCDWDQDNDGCRKEWGDNYDTCGAYSDAMVCTGEWDGAEITCNNEIFRGCYYGQSDIPDPNNPNEDYCCAGWAMPGFVNDNIDHWGCSNNMDAEWGATCFYYDLDNDGCS